MAQKTGIITFNVHHRGRKYRGQNRNFDTAALAKLVNGGEVQERVANRDLKGYFGHNPRLIFGMDVAEGKVINGKYVHVPPAIVTTYLKAHDDGTIEHEAEFLDTAPGRIAERMFNSRVGGFSTAITSKPLAGRDFPVGFYGFDYVNEPNVSPNRGYKLALDGIGDYEADESIVALLDEASDYTNMLDAVNSLYDKLQGEYELLARALQQSEMEREQYLGMLVKSGGKPKLVLDGVRAGTIDVRHETRFDSASDFLSAQLGEFEQPPVKAEEQIDEAQEGKRLLGRMFR